jgi:hypothetical protein
MLCPSPRQRRRGLSDGETAATAMLREYTDKDGTPWRVWDVYLTPRGAASSTRQFADGWLCFESPTEKRRLAPIPREWELCEGSLLEEMCARASSISRLIPPPDVS